MHFPYILTVTLLSPLVFDGDVHLELKNFIAKLLSSMRHLIQYTYWGGQINVFNFTVSNLGEGYINKFTSDSDSGVQTTPKRSRKVNSSTINDFA